jgi:murein DD-endopeptidase MepM/ murein hydrolase activator NlpD
MLGRRGLSKAALVAALTLSIIGGAAPDARSEPAPDDPPAPAPPAESPDETDDPPPTTTTTPPPTTTTTPPRAVPPASRLPANDAPGEAVPRVDTAVPPSATPPVVAPGVTGTLEVQLAEMRRAQAERANTLRAATARVRQLESELEAADAAIDRHQERATEVYRAFTHAENRLRQRAVGAYVWSGPNEAMPIVEAVFDSDAAAMDEVRANRERLDGELARLTERRLDVSNRLEEARKAEAEARAASEGARLELTAVMAGSQVVIHGFVFPVAGPHSFGNSWGAPRMMGTGYAHSHQGTDILAAHGTPLVAVERGMILRMGTGTLGGTKVWVKGESGTYYYYAHLSAYAPGLADGQLVEVGTVIGFVGDTGNARGGPPHLHFEVHPGGGGPVNPYPLLAAADR